jgi:hypothetical protein
MIRFPNSKLLLHASHAALPILYSSKLPPVVDAVDLIVFQIIDKNNQKFKIRSSELNEGGRNKEIILKTLELQAVIES